MKAGDLFEIGKTERSHTNSLVCSLGTEMTGVGNPPDAEIFFGCLINLTEFKKKCKICKLIRQVKHIFLDFTILIISKC